MNTNDVAVSIVTMNGRKYLQRCLDAVFAQTHRSIGVYVLDNASSDGTASFVSANFPEVTIILADRNIGFGAGHNQVIRRTQAPFVLVLNQDAYLAPTFIEELVAAMNANPRVGIAGGKLYSLRNAAPNGNSENILDMTWLDIEKKRRQVCYAMGSRDEGDYSSPSLVFAIDGAATLLRRSMLEDVQFEGEYYDEDFFAGKEDLDISWRAQLCGWKCLYVPSAVGDHLRTFTPKDRRSQIPEVLRVSSIRNRYLLMMKNDLLRHFLRHLPHILAYDLKIFGYLLLRERSSLKGYAQVLQLLPRAAKKRRAIMSRKRVDDGYILQWFR